MLGSPPGRQAVWEETPRRDSAAWFRRHGPTIIARSLFTLALPVHPEMTRRLASPRKQSSIKASESLTRDLKTTNCALIREKKKKKKRVRSRGNTA